MAKPLHPSPPPPAPPPAVVDADGVRIEDRKAVTAVARYGRAKTAVETRLTLEAEGAGRDAVKGALKREVKACNAAANAFLKAAGFRSAFFRKR